MDLRLSAGTRPLIVARSNEVGATIWSPAAHHVELDDPQQALAKHPLACSGTRGEARPELQARQASPLPEAEAVEEMGGLLPVAFHAHSEVEMHLAAEESLEFEPRLGPGVPQQ